MNEKEVKAVFFKEYAKLNKLWNYYQEQNEEEKAAGIIAGQSTITNLYSKLFDLDFCAALDALREGATLL